ncbi:MAG: hypothetical protein M3Z17_04360 [Gemmatimonadota bacterium]|nr:hypothetical protein [Gemmatimonadota bacterium]
MHVLDDQHQALLFRHRIDEIEDCEANQLEHALRIHLHRVLRIAPGVELCQPLKIGNGIRRAAERSAHFEELGDSLYEDGERSLCIPAPAGYASHLNPLQLAEPSQLGREPALANARISEKQTTASFTTARIVEECCEELHVRLAADENSFCSTRHRRLRNSFRDSLSHQVRRELEISAARTKVGDITVELRYRLTLGAPHRRGLRSGENRLLIEGVDFQTHSSQSFDSHPIAAAARATDVAYQKPAGGRPELSSL